MNAKKIIIGNDHGGYQLKLDLVDYLKAKGYAIEDIGSYSEDIVRYPNYASKVSRAVSADSSLRGILICSTGIGMSIVANKYKGIKAALCYSSYQAKMTSAHNKSNVICLGGLCLGSFEARDIIDNWLLSEYEGGRHDISLELIKELEDINFSEKLWDSNLRDLA